MLPAHRPGSRALGALVLALSATAGCGHDWDKYDPSIAGSASGAGATTTSGATTSNGGMGGAGASGSPASTGAGAAGGDGAGGTGGLAPARCGGMNVLADGFGDPQTSAGV